MTAGWLTTPFEDCIEKVTYTAKIQRKDFLDVGEFPIVSQEESFINGYWNDAADVFSVPSPIVIFGDHTKVFKFVDFDFVLGADGVKLLPPKGFLLPKFFYYQLQSVNLDSLGYARHYKLLRELELRYPPLPEQQRIVTLLDEAFDGIATARANAEQNLQNARAIFESHLQSVFTQRGDGWAEKRLADVTTIINGFAFKSGDFSPHAKVQSIKITNVGVREFVCESDSLLPSDFLETYASFSIRAGSIVIALTRTIISGGLKVAIVPDEFDGALLNQRVAAILVSPNLLNAEFLFAYLSSQYVFDYVKAHVNTLMQPNLSINDLRAMPIPLPPAIEQERIADRFEVLKEETQRLESLYQRKLTALDELKKSLLHQAFSGAL